ncbi:MAG TPA: thiamine phosphate synthase [Myxococcota bacterium]
MIDRGAAPEATPARVAAAVRGGVDWIQVRERGLEGAALLGLVDAVIAAARGAAGGREVRVLVNRRLDVALAAGADGVHLGGDALPPAAARRLLPKGALVGVSTHAVGEALAAREADYLQLAPIFAPISKKPERPALGLAALAAAAAGRLPVLAQGGIDARSAAAARAAGAAGVAVTGAIWLAPDPFAAAAGLREALDG